DWLEPRIVLRSGTISRNPLSQPRVKLYVDACLLLGDYGRVEKLERQLAASGSPLLESQALSFGLSRFVRNHVDEAADFFESWLDNKKTENRDWLRFAFGFCRLLQGRFKESLPWFSGAARSDDAVLASAAAYLLSTISPLVAESDETPGKSGFAEKHNEDESLKLAGETRKRLLQAFPGKKLDEEFSRASGEMHVAFFGKILDDAKAWVTGGEGNEAIVHEKEINNIGFHAENVNR
ncbi:MAG: hypothetical protein Q8O19_08075, partial [Rectinemataceae bacterium]|nr:hypothetical protein [Rectinemataceae bacterium]